MQHFFFSAEKEPGRQCGKKTSLNLDQVVQNSQLQHKRSFCAGGA
jgi:hypothetical protein